MFCTVVGCLIATIVVLMTVYRFDRGAGGCRVENKNAMVVFQMAEDQNWPTAFTLKTLLTVFWASYSHWHGIYTAKNNTTSPFLWQNNQTAFRLKFGTVAQVVRAK